MARKKRRFGQIDRLPSGKTRARYTGPDGALHKAPKPFHEEDDAIAWLRSEEKKIALDAAVSRGLIPANPASGITEIKRVPPARKQLTELSDTTDRDAPSAKALGEIRLNATAVLVPEVPAVRPDLAWPGAGLISEKSPLLPNDWPGSI